mgnify:CR=1 FL=1
MMSGRNVFLTGPAGSGKTHVLNRYIREMRSRGARVAVTASTGIAATHLGGMTVHSWSGIGAKDALSEKAVRELVLSSYLKRRFAKTDILVIDEVSMIASHVFDLIDHVCRAGRVESNKPFGGMQVILCGDLFQLPPVIADRPDKQQNIFARDENAVFVHRSRAWEEMDPAVCYLETQYRQSDTRLTELLNAIRSGSIDDAVRETIAELIAAKPREAASIDLFTHNADVDTLNLRKLAQLNTEGRRYRMKTEGRQGAGEYLKRACLAPEVSVIKKGAQVVFVKNDPNRAYVNGTLGVVEDFDDEGFPIVRTRDRSLIVAYPQAWALEVDGRDVARVEQIPLRLAWAITVHKSQGMTLDAARVDLSRSFVPGMGYVAISRVRSLAGLDLTGCNDEALRVHPCIAEYDRELMRDSQALDNEWRALSPDERRRRMDRFLDAVGKKRKRPGATMEKTAELIRGRKTLVEMARERQLKPSTILAHTEKLLEKGTLAATDVSYLAEDAGISKDEYTSIHTAFLAEESWNLSPIHEHFQGKYSYETLRLARMLMRNEEKGE